MTPVSGVVLAPHQITSVEEVSDEDLRDAIKRKCSDKNIISLMKKNNFTSAFFPETTKEPIEEGWKKLDISEIDKSHLVNDCFIEILKWLPMSELIRLKRVSKSWSAGAEKAITQLLNSLSKTLKIVVPTFVLFRPYKMRVDDSGRKELYTGDQGPFITDWKDSIKLDSYNFKEITSDSNLNSHANLQFFNYQNFTNIFELLKNSKMNSIRHINYRPISDDNPHAAVPPFSFVNPILPAILVLYHVLTNPQPQTQELKKCHNFVLTFLPKDNETKREISSISYFSEYFLIQPSKYNPMRIFLKGSNDAYPICVINMKDL